MTAEPDIGTHSHECWVQRDTIERRDSAIDKGPAEVLLSPDVEAPQTRVVRIALKLRAQRWRAQRGGAADKPTRTPSGRLGEQVRWLSSRFIPHRHRPRAELQPAYELQVDTLREPREQRRPMAR